MVRLGKDQGMRLDAVVERGVEWGSVLGRREGELKRTRDGGFKVRDPRGEYRMRMLRRLRRISRARRIRCGRTWRRCRAWCLPRSLSSPPICTSGCSRTARPSQNVRPSLLGMALTCSPDVSLAYDNMSRAKRARIDATDSMAADVQASYRSMQRGVASTSRNLETTTGQVLSEVRFLRSSFPVSRCPLLTRPSLSPGVRPLARRPDPPRDLDRAPLGDLPDVAAAPRPGRTGGHADGDDAAEADVRVRGRVDAHAEPGGAA